MISKRKFSQIVFWTAVVCLAGLILIAGIPLARRIVYPVRYEETVRSLALRDNLDPALIFAVIRTESNFRERAESGAGAKGLMQITDRTAEYIASSRGSEAYDLFCAEDNLDFGCWYLRYLFDRFPDERTALAAYNAGEGTVRGWLSDAALSPDGKTLSEIPYRETEQYLEKISRTYEKYKKYYPQLLDKTGKMR